MHLGTRGRGRLKSLMSMDVGQQQLGTWPHPMEKIRRKVKSLNYIPSYFLRKKLRMYDEYNPNEKVMSLSQAAVVEKKEQIVFAWIDNAKLEQQFKFVRLKFSH